MTRIPDVAGQSFVRRRLECELIPIRMSVLVTRFRVGPAIIPAQHHVDDFNNILVYRIAFS
jgi:hypothetical protein